MFSRILDRSFSLSFSKSQCQHLFKTYERSKYQWVIKIPMSDQNTNEQSKYQQMLSYKVHNTNGQKYQQKKWSKYHFAGIMIIGILNVGILILTRHFLLHLFFRQCPASSLVIFRKPLQLFAQCWIIKTNSCYCNIVLNLRASLKSWNLSIIFWPMLTHLIIICKSDQYLWDWFWKHDKARTDEESKSAKQESFPTLLPS